MPTCWNSHFTSIGFTEYKNHPKIKTPPIRMMVSSSLKTYLDSEATLDEVVVLDGPVLSTRFIKLRDQQFQNHW